MSGEKRLDNWNRVERPVVKKHGVDDGLANSVVVAMLGARMHYAVPALLASTRLLNHFFTDAYLGQKSILRNACSVIAYLPEKLQPSLAKTAVARYEKGIPPGRITSFDLLGVSSILLRNCFKSQSWQDRVNLCTGRIFCKKILNRGLPAGTRCIYGYRTAALELVEYAKNHGIKSIVEQTIAPKRIEYTILREEFEAWEDWQKLGDFGLLEEMSRRETKEWENADLIVAGSEFVKKGLEDSGVSGKKVLVVPYGIDLEKFSAKGRGEFSGKTLKLLFAGEVGLRKGIQYLYKALALTDQKSVNCRVVGKVSISERGVREINRYAELKGQVPKSEMVRLMTWADVFVLPTLCEGSATVTYEAMACGIPVITTPNCGSLVRDGIDGFIVGIRDEVGLAERIERLICDRNLLKEMSNNALERAKELSWENYGGRLKRTIEHLLAS